MASSPWPFNEGWTFRKAQAFDREAILSCGSTIIGEQKLDGWRALVVCDERGDEHVYSRGISRVTGLPIDLMHEYGEIPCLRSVFDVIGPKTALECELVWPEHFASDVPTALATRRQALKAPLYGAPYVGGVVRPEYREERDYLLGMFHPTDLAFVMFAYPRAGMLPTEEEMLLYSGTTKFEGFIFKALYGEQRWWKWKREFDMDLVVIGWKPGEGKYVGQVGALRVGKVIAITEGNETVLLGVNSTSEADMMLEYPGETLYIKEVARVSGMTDDERDEMSKNPDDLTGRVCEVTAQAVGGKYRLRHPRFKRWRDDKPARECV